MPEKQSSQAQTQTSKQGEVKWWIPAIIGILMLMIPGGAYATPVFFALSIIMKVRRKPKSPETSPSLLFQFTP